MPKLWDATIEAHRRQVHEAILRTTASLAAEHGVRAVTMSRIAEDVGIGRATLYKYFAGVEEILHAWHQRRVAGHLEELTEIRDRPATPRDRLEALLRAYGSMRNQRGQAHRTGAHGRELDAFLHHGGPLDPAEQQLREVFRALLAEATDAGVVRDDCSPDELVAYCLHALDAAHEMHSEAAVRCLVEVVLAGLRPD